MTDLLPPSPHSQPNSNTTTHPQDTKSQDPPPNTPIHNRSGARRSQWTSGCHYLRYFSREKSEDDLSDESSIGDNEELGSFGDDDLSVMTIKEDQEQDIYGRSGKRLTYEQPPNGTYI